MFGAANSRLWQRGARRLGSAASGHSRELLSEPRCRAGRGHRSVEGMRPPSTRMSAGDVAGPWTGQEGDDVGLVELAPCAASRAQAQDDDVCVMSRSPTSRARVLLHATRLDLSALDRPRFGMGATTPLEVFVMMRPHLRSRIPGSTASVIAMTETTMLVKNRVQSSGRCPDAGVGGGRPSYSR